MNNSELEIGGVHSMEQPSIMIVDGEGNLRLEVGEGRRTGLWLFASGR